MYDCLLCKVKETETMESAGYPDGSMRTSYHIRVEKIP